MNDHESDFGRKVARYLDQGAADLRPGTLYRLQQARTAALAGRAAAHAGGLALATGAGRSSSHGAPWASPARWVGAALLVGAIGFGFQQWYAVQQVREFEELDLHLLASDLPIDAYLDRGFQNWLRTAFER